MYPKIEDFKALVLNCGKGCYMYKRDLSTFFLQIPLDPVNYSQVAFIWRSSVFFFVRLMFGLRHSSYQGQRITDAITWVHKNMGLLTEPEKLYNSLNYCDDIAGVEKTRERAISSSEALENLFKELGLDESK